MNRSSTEIYKIIIRKKLSFIIISQINYKIIDKFSKVFIQFGENHEFILYFFTTNFQNVLYNYNRES